MKKLKGNSLEQFYTNENTSLECVNYIETFLEDNNINIDTIIEPSAGTGSFLKALKKSNVKYNTLIALDIEPKFQGIVKKDFLKEFDKHESNNVLIIGNPPFGKNSCIAKKFIKKSCEIGDIIAFILPRSFKKESMSKAFNYFFHIKKCIDIPCNSFIFEEKPYDVPCVFQIWIKQHNKREITELIKPIGWEFCDISVANIAFQRVGSKAGLFKLLLSNLSHQTHYFLNVPKKYIPFIYNNEFYWESKEWTVGPKSISKQELIRVLNYFIKNNLIL
jgi:predicted RNA methylase